MLIDITRPVHPGMAIYPGNPEVSFEEVSKAGPDTSALTRITLGSHTGTHIDAPSHIYDEASGTGSYSLEAMIGPAEVIEARNVSGNRIQASNLPATAAERILIKTENSAGNINAFNADFFALDESAAEEIVGRGVKLVGIDAPSVKKKGVKDKVHSILLDAGIVIIEGLWLADAQPGQYELMCLALYVDLDGAPVRAVLRS